MINSPLKNKGRYDWSVTNVHLLTSKSSSQMFFLRTLKVIVQIRESVRVANKRQKDAGGEFIGDSLSFLKKSYQICYYSSNMLLTVYRTLSYIINFNYAPAK